MRVLFDTSVLVAALVEPHPAHSRAFPWLKRVMSGEHSMVIAAHTLAELYAVLTTLPVSPRITPELAWRLLQDSVLGSAEISQLSSSDYKTVLKGLKDSGMSGGIVYDALILFAAVKARAEKLLTLNSADFRRLSMSSELDIVEP